MNKALRIVATLGIVALLGGFTPMSFHVNDAQASEDMGWLDPANCDMCAPMVAEEGLMDAMTWEHHLVSSGCMALTTVAEGFEEKYQAAMAGMMKVMDKAKKGEEVNMCGHCVSMGELMKTGKVTRDNVETTAGHVMLMTSGDPETVKMIHAHANRTTEEMKKWMEAEKAKGAQSQTGHEGHDH